MNIDALLAEMGDDLPEGFVEDLARIRNALYSSSITDLYTVQGEGFVLHLQGAVVGVNAMIGIRIESPNIQKLLHGSCNVFSLFRLTWVLGQLEVEALEDILEDDEILEAVHMIVTKGEEADEDAYDLLDFETTQLVSEAFGQVIPATVVEFALAHTDDLCPHHVTEELERATIQWGPRLAEVGILTLEEAESLAILRQALIAKYNEVMALWVPYLQAAAFGQVPSLLEGDVAKTITLAKDSIIILVEEKLPNIKEIDQTVVVLALTWAVIHTGKQTPETSVQVAVDWLESNDFAHYSALARLRSRAYPLVRNITDMPTVRELTYGKW